MTTTGRRCARIDCTRPHHARGLCFTHYKKLLRAIARYARTRTTTREETPTVTQPKPDPLAWLDYDLLQTTLDDRTVTDLTWQDGAPCVDSDVDMFPNNTTGVTKAKTVCQDCPVKYPCLAYALIIVEANSDFGVSGFTSQRERAKIRRRGRVVIPARERVSMRGGPFR